MIIKPIWFSLQLFYRLVLDRQKRIIANFFSRWISDPFIDKIRSELEEKDETKALERAKSEAKMEAKAQKKKEMLLKSLRDDEDD